MQLDPDHYGVTVSDLETALAFYRDTLGLEQTEELSFESSAFSTFVGVEDVDVNIVFLGGDGFSIELLEYARTDETSRAPSLENTEVGASHVCFAVDDLETIYEQLESDVSFVSSPQTLDNGAKVVYLHDPDGNTVELVEK